MERRRLELGLRWREVAEAGGISYEAVRSVRNGNSKIALLSQRGIEVGLRWAPGSVQNILDDGDPVPLGGLSGSGTLSGTAASTGVASAGDSPLVIRIVRTVMEEIEADAEEEIARIEGQVRDEIRRHPGGAPAGRIFTHPAEVALWQMEITPEAQRVREIAEFRFARRRPFRSPGQDPAPARHAG